MKITPLVLAMCMVAPSAALAQATAGSNSQSGAQSNIVLEGSEYGTPAPGLGGIAGNSTAPCALSQGIGIVGPGAGFQIGNTRIDRDCLTRTEAAMVMQLVDMPPSRGRQAAIYHACTYSDRLRNTLVAAGVCAVKGAKQ